MVKLLPAPSNAFELSIKVDNSPKPKNNLFVADKLLFFVTERARYKVAYGGRGGAKSESIARALIIRSMQEPLRILCTRDLQTSIATSVHQVLRDIIRSMPELDAWFTITDEKITNKTGSEFFFKGLRNNINDIKSMQGIDICWIEEAANVSKKSWDILIPTIRKPGAEIWVSFNPDSADDPTYQRFALDYYPEWKDGKRYFIKQRINYYDNPWFGEPLKSEMEFLKGHDFQDYLHVWEGEPKTNKEAQIFKNRWEIDTFETPPLEKMFEERFFLGGDWGFSQDPACVVRCFMSRDQSILYIDREAGGVGIENDELPAMYDEIPNIKEWRVLADSARPETISHMRNKGYDVVAVDKWKGSVEDGIAYLRGFKKIVIHARCKKTIDEFKLYKYKEDRITGEVLRQIVDKNNHYIDALRYALNKYIQRKRRVNFAKLL